MVHKIRQLLMVLALILILTTTNAAPYAGYTQNIRTTIDTDRLTATIDNNHVLLLDLNADWAGWAIVDGNLNGLTITMDDNINDLNFTILEITSGTDANIALTIDTQFSKDTNISFLMWLKNGGTNKSKANGMPSEYKAFFINESVAGNTVTNYANTAINATTGMPASDLNSDGRNKPTSYSADFNGAATAKMIADNAVFAMNAAVSYSLVWWQQLPNIAATNSVLSISTDGGNYNEVYYNGANNMQFWSNEGGRPSYHWDSTDNKIIQDKWQQIVFTHTQQSLLDFNFYVDSARATSSCTGACNGDADGSTRFNQGTGEFGGLQSSLTWVRFLNYIVSPEEIELLYASESKATNFIRFSPIETISSAGIKSTITSPTENLRYATSSINATWRCQGDTAFNYNRAQLGNTIIYDNNDINNQQNTVDMSTWLNVTSYNTYDLNITCWTDGNAASDTNLVTFIYNTLPTVTTCNILNQNLSDVNTLMVDDNIYIDAAATDADGNALTWVFRISNEYDNNILLQDKDWNTYDLQRTDFMNDINAECAACDFLGYCTDTNGTDTFNGLIDKTLHVEVWKNSVTPVEQITNFDINWVGLVNQFYTSTNDYNMSTFLNKSNPTFDYNIFVWDNTNGFRDQNNLPDGNTLDGNIDDMNIIMFPNQLKLTFENAPTTGRITYLVGQDDQNQDGQDWNAWSTPYQIVYTQQGLPSTRITVEFNDANTPTQMFQYDNTAGLHIDQNMWVLTGIYAADRNIIIQVTDKAGGALRDALVSLEMWTQFDNNHYKLISRRYTDDDGYAVFRVMGSAHHRITVTKDGYTANPKSITPLELLSGNLILIQMDSTLMQRIGGLLAWAGQPARLPYAPYNLKIFAIRTSGTAVEFRAYINGTEQAALRRYSREQNLYYNLLTATDYNGIYEIRLYHDGNLAYDFNFGVIGTYEDKNLMTPFTTPTTEDGLLDQYTLLFLALILGAGIVGYYTDAGIHAFMIGIVLLSTVNLYLVPMSFMAYAYYVAEFFRRWAQRG